MRSRHGLSEKHATSACHFGLDCGGDYFLTVECYVGNVTENIKGAFSCREMIDFAGVHLTCIEQVSEGRGRREDRSDLLLRLQPHRWSMIFAEGGAGPLGNLEQPPRALDKDFEEVHDLNPDRPRRLGPGALRRTFREKSRAKVGIKASRKNSGRRMGICNDRFYAKHHYDGLGH